MAVSAIIKLPDKRLRLVSEPVKRIDAGIRELVEDMFEPSITCPVSGSRRSRSASPSAS